MKQTTQGGKSRVNRHLIPLLPTLIICSLFSLAATVAVYLQIRSDLVLEGERILDQIEATEQLYLDHLADDANLNMTIDSLLQPSDVSEIIIQDGGERQHYTRNIDNVKKSLDLRLSNWLFGGRYATVQLHRQIVHPFSGKQLALSIKLNPISSGRYLVYLALCSVFFLVLFTMSLLHVTWLAHRHKTSVTATADVDGKAFNATQPAAQSPNLSVLVVDDNEISCKIMQVFLNSLGHRVVLASSGEMALQQLAERQIDLVFIDMHMPGMSGPETVAHLRRQNHSYRHIPVIGLSADNNPASLRQALQAGMDEFLLKPINQTDISKILQRWQEPIMQRARNHSAQSNDLQSLRAMLIAELPDHRSVLEQAYESGDHDFLYETAHKITGGSVYCQMPQLEQAARALQSVARSGDPELIAEQTRSLLLTIDSTLNSHKQA